MITVTADEHVKFGGIIAEVAVSAAQFTLLFWGIAAVLNESLAWPLQLGGLAASFAGLVWAEGVADRQGYRRGFRHGWKLRGTQSDVLAYRHYLRWRNDGGEA